MRTSYLPVMHSFGQYVFKGSNQKSATVRNTLTHTVYYLDLNIWTSDLRKIKRSSLFHEEHDFLQCILSKNATECIWLNCMTANFHVVHKYDLIRWSFDYLEICFSKNGEQKIKYKKSTHICILYHLKTWTRELTNFKS